MAQTDVFALDKSDLNGFLFADIGFEGNGMPLSVISLLARLGLDPWQEAGRLARLPRTVAADGLARLIAAMPASLWPMSDATPIATRLVALLPRRNDTPVIVAKGLKLSWTWVLLAIVTAVLLLQVAIRMTTTPQTEISTLPSISAPLMPTTD